MNKNALICFLKFPDPGRVKTRLAADLDDPEVAAALYEALAERVVTEIYPLDAGYDVFLFVDDHTDLDRYREWLGADWRYRPQSNGDLGERLSDAFAECFETGYRKVAVIGSDCVGLDQEFIETMFQNLDHNTAVMGPSMDGGYYLLAVKEHSPWLFDDMPWSTEEVQQITKDRIENREGTLYMLPEKRDVDTLEDLVALRESLPPEHFLVSKIDALVLSKVTLEGDPDDILDKI